MNIPTEAVVAVGSAVAGWAALTLVAHGTKIAALIAQHDHLNAWLTRVETKLDRILGQCPQFRAPGESPQAADCDTVRQSEPPRPR